MKAVEALRAGWKQVLLHRKLWLILYVFNLIFALIAVMPLRGWLKKTTGYSLELNRSIGQFDFTFLTDLIRNHDGYTILCSQALTLVIAYLFFSTFLSGGILHIYIHWREQFLLKEFLHGASKYFWRILGVAILFLLMQMVLLGILIFVLLSIGINPREMESDVHMLQIIKWVLAVYLILALVLTIMHTYAKLHVVQQDQGSVVKSVIGGIRFVFRHFKKVVLLYGINIMLFIGLFAFYLFVRKIVSTETAGSLLLSFVLAQLFLIGRIVLKLLTISSANELMQAQAQTQIQTQTQMQGQIDSASGS